MEPFEQLGKKQRYEEGLLELIAKAYGGRAAGILTSLMRAPKEYAVRVNASKATVDEVIEAFSAGGTRCRPSPLVDEAVLLGVEGPFEVNGEGKKVVASKGAAESVMMGSKLYGPGIRRTDGYTVGETVCIADIYDHIVGRGIAVLPPKVSNRVARGIAVDVNESIYRLPPIRESELYIKGKIREQSIPAMLASKALDPQKGDIVVDMCAAPGGKTLHVAQIMEGKGMVYAFDHSEKRLESLKEDAARLGPANIKAFCSDSRYLDKDFPGLEADRVLVDPPCTALGVRPKLFEDAKAKDVFGCAKYQKQFMAVASRIVRKGGVIVYSTCTLSLEENEEVARFSVDELGLEPEGQGIMVGERGLGSGCLAGIQRFSPDLLEMPGYFIAKFRK